MVPLLTFRLFVYSLFRFQTERYSLHIFCKLEEKDIEQMGFECLAFDQDRVAQEIARARNMNWAELQTSSLPAVAEEIVLPGAC